MQACCTVQHRADHQSCAGCIFDLVVKEWSPLELSTMVEERPNLFALELSNRADARDSNDLKAIALLLISDRAVGVRITKRVEETKGRRAVRGLMSTEAMQRACLTPL